MYRKPHTKEQARILAQEFEAYGVKLAHRQALDVLARVNGHASWHVMRKYEKSQASASGSVMQPTPPGSLAPVVLAETPRPDRDIVYYFEAMGFVETREILDAIVSHVEVPLLPEVRSRLKELGFTALRSIDLSEDDEQDDEDIKVFVSIRLIGPATLKQQAGLSWDIPHDYLALLDAIAPFACSTADGEDCVGPENWELVDTDEL